MPFKAGLTATVVLTLGLITAFITPKTKIKADKGFAVVELFTSEGCSSCPPADALAAKIQRENNPSVYILAYHVDYWNRLGWKDVFSKAAFSARQKQYAGWLHLDGVYTPQAVVNGRREFVAAEEGTMRNAIKKNLQSKTVNQLILNNIRNDNNRIELNYQTDAVSNFTDLVLAIVQKTATTQVKSGENGGQTLAHVQIVRALQTVALAGKTNGSVHMEIPEHLNQTNLELIAFLQDTRNGEITAAAKAAFPATVLTQLSQK